MHVHELLKNLLHDLWQKDLDHLHGHLDLLISCALGKRSAGECSWLPQKISVATMNDVRSKHINELLFRFPRPRCGSRAWPAPFSRHLMQERIFDNDLPVILSVLLDHTPRVLAFRLCLQTCPCCVRFRSPNSHGAAKRAPDNHPCMDNKTFESKRHIDHRDLHNHSSKRAARARTHLHIFIPLAITIKNQIHPIYREVSKEDRTDLLPIANRLPSHEHPPLHHVFLIPVNEVDGSMFERF